MASEALGNRIRELRKARRFTQLDLAERVDVTRQTIIAIEKGQYNPSVVLAMKIAQVFQRPLEEIFWLKNDNG